MGIGMEESANLHTQLEWKSQQAYTHSSAGYEQCAAELLVAELLNNVPYNKNACWNKIVGSTEQTKHGELELAVGTKKENKRVSMLKQLYMSKSVWVRSNIHYE